MKKDLTVKWLIDSFLTPHNLELETSIECFKSSGRKRNLNIIYKNQNNYMSFSWFRWGFMKGFLPYKSNHNSRSKRSPSTDVHKCILFIRIEKTSKNVFLQTLSISSAILIFSSFRSQIGDL